MQDMSAWIHALGGFVIGVVAGFAVRHARLCSFGAIEDAMMGGDTRRLRVFGLALGIAILGTQALIVSGVFELLGAAGITIRRTRRMAGIGLTLLTIAVTPANVFMLQHAELFPGVPVWALIARLPLQLALIACILWSTQRTN